MLDFRFRLHAGGGEVQALFGRDRLFANIDTYADYHAIHALPRPDGFRQDAADFAAVEQNIIGPFDPGVKPNASRV